MPDLMRWRARSAVFLSSLGLATATLAASTATPPPAAHDAQLFYQVLLGEMELRSGNPGTAFRAYLDAAKRTRDATLFRRAMDIALQARAGNEALEATRAWREAAPDALDPLRLEIQILAAMGRVGEARELTSRLVELTPATERPQLISALPRLLDRAADKPETAKLLADVLEPYRKDPATRAAAVVALGTAWLAAGDTEQALALARQGVADDPGARGPALLALELSRTRPEGEAIVTRYLERPDADPALRLAYAQILTSALRLQDALRQIEVVVASRPDDARALLMQGALQLELRRFDLAEESLRRYVGMVQPQPAATGATAATAEATAASAPAAVAASPAAPAGDSGHDDDVHADTNDEDPPSAQQGLIQAWLMLAQVARHRGDFAGAEQWLARIDDPRRALEVQAQRAAILARQGQVDAALALLEQVPEHGDEDARNKFVAKAAMLRDVKQWARAFEVFERALKRFPDDVDLLYEQAMVAEQLDRVDEMERLLRRVIEIKPDHGHAHNALGYSLADRSERLPEARELIRKALELMPGDPYITDSLGWVEFRLGNLEDAARLLQQAWDSRPDTEIGAHLGEVLWSLGRQEDARQVWRQAIARDSRNEVLLETLARLQVQL